MHLLVIISIISLSTAHQLGNFQSTESGRRQPDYECNNFKEYLSNAGQQTIHVPPLKMRGMFLMSTTKRVGRTSAYGHVFCSGCCGFY